MKIAKARVLHALKNSSSETKQKVDGKTMMKKKSKEQKKGKRVPKRLEGMAPLFG